MNDAAPVAADAAAAPLVTTEIIDKVGIVTLDNARKRNALSAALIEGLIAALDVFRKQSIRAVIIRAAPGMKVWSAGHDIKELPRHEDPLGYSDPLERALRAIRGYPGPVVAMVQGSVWGGAFDLVLSCDMIVADDSSSFAITPANLGLAYNTTGLMHCLGRLPANLVKEMFFTAAPLKAEEARRWGIINHLVAAEEIETHTKDLAALMASKAPLAIAVIKEQLHVLSDYQPIAAQVFERLQDMRRKVYESADYEEGINAFFEKRKPVFKGV